MDAPATSPADSLYLCCYVSTVLREQRLRWYLNNDIVVFMIPDFETGVLPPGEHLATPQEAFEAFGWTSHRQVLLQGFQRGVANLASARCTAVWLDGSFVTSKEVPGDFDACWDPTGVDLDRVDPVLKDLSGKRLAQKAKYGGEFFPNIIETGSGRFFVEFFQADRNGTAKGIIRVDVQEWTS